MSDFKRGYQIIAWLADIKGLISHTLKNTIKFQVWYKHYNNDKKVIGKILAYNADF